MSLVENTSILTKCEDCFCCVILPIIRGDSVSLTRTRTCVHFEMNQVPNVGVRNLKNFDVVVIGFSWIKLFEPKTASPWTASFIDGNVLARIECCFELCITHINEWLQFGQRLMLWVRVGGFAWSSGTWKLLSMAWNLSLGMHILKKGVLVSSLRDQ